MTELPIWSLALIFWFGGAVLTLAVGLIVHMMSSTSDQRDSYASVINARWGAYRRQKAATDGESKSIF